jgi:radical SAM protein with 4Fe4S-binding SPASM domain
MPQPQRLRDWVVPQSEVVVPDQVAPGLHHFQKRIDGGFMRYHLRVDPDGYGVLIAGASEAVLLSPAGVAAAMGLLQDRSKDRLASELQTPGGTRIVEDVAKVLAELGHPSSRFPIFNLVDPEVVGQRLRLPAPFQADVVVGPGGNMIEMLDRLWAVHVPHVRFVWPQTFPSNYVVRGVTHAEDIGMIAGVRGTATQWSTDNAIIELAECGLDYVVVPWGVTREQHVAMYGEADWQKLPEVIDSIRRYEMTPVLDAPLHPAILDNFDDELQKIESWDVHHLEVFAIATTQSNNSTAFQHQELRQVATWLEDLADAGDMQLIWLPPVAQTAGRSLADTAKLGPRAGGDVTIRVEMDGRVIPPRGNYVSAGNILTERWTNIWNHPAFTRYRDRVEAPTRCDACPGLAICAAACPADPDTWVIHPES